MFEYQKSQLFISDTTYSAMDTIQYLFEIKETSSQYIEINISILELKVTAEQRIQAYLCPEKLTLL